MMNSRHLSVGSTRLMTNNKKQNNNNTLNKLRERLIALEINSAIRKKKSGNARKSTRNTRQSRRSGPPGSSGLSACAATYLLACTKPRALMNRSDVCIPSFPCIPSQKVRATSRFNFAIGTAGIGFVAVAPCLASDAVCLWYTDATYTGTSVNLYDSAGVLITGVNTATLSSLPFSNATLIASDADTVRAPRGRIVSSSLMCTYDGDRQTCGGSYYGYTTPDHQSVEGMTAALIGAATNGIVKKVTPGDRGGLEVIAYGIDSDETDYPHQAVWQTPATAYSTIVYPFSGGIYNEDSGAGATTGAAIMACLVSSKAANVFFADYVQFQEYIGASGVVNTTPTVGDAAGFEVASAALGQMADAQCANPDTPLNVLASKLAQTAWENRVPLTNVGLNLYMNGNRPLEYLSRQQVIQNGGGRRRAR